MKPTTTLLLGGAVLLLAALPAAAQPYGAPPYGPSDSSIRLSPFAAYRYGGEFKDVFFGGDVLSFSDIEVDDGAAFGVALEARLTGDLFLELWASRQETEVGRGAGIFLPLEALFDLDVEYFQVGLLYEWRPGQVHPFLAGSLGATRFSPHAPDLDDLVRPSFSFGAGAVVMVSDHVGVRFEGRFIATLVDDSDEEFCSRRVCYDFETDVYFYQTEARAGLLFGF